MKVDQILSQFAAHGVETCFHDRHINPQIYAGLNGSISRNGKQQDAMSARLAQMEARLTKQYQQLDLQMAKLNQLGNYVNQQVNAWSK